MEENKNVQRSVRVQKGVYEIPPLRAAETMPAAPQEEAVAEDTAPVVSEEPVAAETPVTAAPAAPVNIADAYLASVGKIDEDETAVTDDYAEYGDYAGDAISAQPGEEVIPPAAVQSRSSFVPATNPLKLAIEHGDVVIDEDAVDYDEDYEDDGYRRETPARPVRRTNDGPRLFGVFEKGESPFVLITSLINICITGLFTVLYIICIACREILISEAIQRMTMTGITDYTIEVTSPLFGFLKLLLFIVPVLLIVWTVGTAVASSKKKALPDRAIVICAYALDLVAGFIAILDVFALRIIFG